MAANRNPAICGDDGYANDLLVLRQAGRLLRMGKTYGRIYEKAKDGLPTIGYGKYPSESETGS